MLWHQAACEGAADLFCSLFIQSHRTFQMHAVNCAKFRQAADEPDSWMLPRAPVRPLRALLSGPRHWLPSFRLVKPNKSERRQLRPLRKPAICGMRKKAGYSRFVKFPPVAGFDH